MLWRRRSEWGIVQSLEKTQIVLISTGKASMDKSTKNATLHLWTVYQNPADFPGHYVARRFELEKATADCFADTELDAVREWIKDEALKTGNSLPYRLPRQPEDDPVILETWL